MSIRTFELSSVDGRRFVKVTDRRVNLRVDHNSTVTLISELGDRQASVDFRFTANYHASEAVVGLIQIEGNILWEGDAKALVKGWSAGGQMPPDVAQEIHTVIMTNCIPEAVLLARELRLPPPIPIPQVNVPQQPGSPRKVAPPKSPDLSESVPGFRNRRFMPDPATLGRAKSPSRFLGGAPRMLRTPGSRARRSRPTGPARSARREWNFAAN